MGVFGGMMLIDDVGGIIKSNEICNRMGLDTISAGRVISWAMECFNRGILTLEDTDGRCSSASDGARTLNNSWVGVTRLATAPPYRSE